MNNIIEQMIGRYEPASLYDRKNAMKEVIQEIVLCGLSRAGFFKKAAFYGGTALRVFYGLDRLSEGLDFSLLKPDTVFELSAYFPALKKEAEAFGLRVDISEKEKNKKSNIQSAFLKGNTKEHLLKFYQTFEDVKERWFDGLIITGAPVEQMPFEQVEYWPELCRIMEWSRTHVHSTFHICWGAQAGLYYHYGIGKTTLPEKLFGVYPHRVERRSSMLMRGFDDVFMVPHSRHTSVRREDIERCGKLKILASSEQAGVYAMATEGGRQIFITGHSEYDARTLESEYLRDKNAGLPIHVPENYYPDDDDTKPPMVTWRSHANLLYQNWLNYFVYQTTPYDLSAIRPV